MNGMYDRCLHDTPRAFEWREANCQKYDSCDTVAWAMDDEKEKNGENETPGAVKKGRIGSDT